MGASRRPGSARRGGGARSACRGWAAASAGTLATSLFMAVALAALTPAAAAPQEDPPGEPGGGALRVFIDCAAIYCDVTHFRREIPFVDWVREPQDALVHVIMTSQAAGGGGQRYTLDFIGRGSLEGLSDQYVHTSSVVDVADDVVSALTRVLGQGLVRFAARAGFGDAFEVRAAAPEGAPGEPAAAESRSPGDDPWDSWVFIVRGNGSVSGEDRRSSHRYGFSLSADRTTETWKTRIAASGSFSRSSFELTDTTIRNDQDSWDVSALAVRAVGGHWGLGAEVEADNSTRLNRDLLVALEAC